MPTDTPWLNDYKKPFVYNRLLQTALGGLKLKLEFKAPWYIYFVQVFIFLLPWFLGILFTILADLQLLNFPHPTLIMAFLWFALVGCVHGFSKWLLKNEEKSSYETNAGNGSLTVFESVFRHPIENAKEKEVKLNNVLAQDNIVEFSSFWSVKTFHYLFPHKRFTFNIFFQSLVSGVMCGIGLYYLLPSTITALHVPLSVAILLHILGWLSICNAQYSLTVNPPPEISTFRLTDTLEIICFSRPFYVLVILMVEVASWHHPQVSVVSFSFHILLTLLPVLWFLGILAPIDALIPYLAEQVHVHIFGGSSMTGGLRLSVMLIISCISLVIGTLVSNIPNTLIVATFFGYLLSLDLTTGIHQLITMSERKGPPDSSISIRMDVLVAEQGGFLWKWTKKELAFHCVIMICSTVFTGVIGLLHIKPDKDIGDGLVYCLLSMVILVKLLEEAQSVYIFFGLIRNKFYPQSTQKCKEFNQTKQRIKPLGYIRRFCLEAAGPVLMLVYLVIFGSQYRHDIPKSTYILCSLRAFRWVWQSTWHSMLEITIAHIINYYTIPKLSQFGLYLELLIIGLVRHRVTQFLKKIFFYFTILVTFWTQDKQRIHHSCLIIVLNILLLPVVLAIIVASCILSMPLLPFFTMPIFFMGFPRHQRFWPSQAGKSANLCPDSVYYKQITPNLVRSLSEALSNGSLGGTNPGDHFLMRYLDRTLWVVILEKGYGYCKVNIRGLELQETSCHTIEATRVDEMFEYAFEGREGQQSGILNPYPLCVMTPCDSIIVNAYSDARNVLTGIIDNLDNLKTLPDLFLKVLLWMLLRFNIKLIRWEYEEPEEPVSKNKKIVERKKEEKHNDQNDKKVEDIINKIQELEETKVNENGVAEEKKVQPIEEKIVILKKRTLTPIKRNKKNEEIKLSVCRFGSTFIEVREATNPVNNQNLTEVSLDDRSYSRDSIDSIPCQWSNNDDLFDNKSDPRRRPNTSGFIHSEIVENDADIPGSVESLDIKSTPGMPAKDIGRMSRTSSENDHQDTLGRRVSQTSFVSPFSIQIVPLSTWMEIPFSPSQVKGIRNLFPVEWYRHVIYSLNFKVENKTSAEIAADISTDPKLEEIYQDLVLGCYLIVSMMGVHGADCTDVGPAHIHKVFTGNIPWSPSSEWLDDEIELKKIILKSYRYAVKLMLDNALLGDINNLVELQAALEDYEKNWFIGPETEERWTSCVQENKANLFSLGFNPIENTFTSRQLSHQDLVVHVGKLNPEVVYGLWASLSLELLYFTNDDEERYSIQAHPTILRNLTIQASDPPLGYPIYNSRPIVLPLLKHPCHQNSCFSSSQNREYTTM